MSNLDSDIQVIQEDIERLNNRAFADLAILTVPNIMKGRPWNIIQDQVARTPDAVSVFNGINKDPLTKKFSYVNPVEARGYSDQYSGALVEVKDVELFFRGYCEAGGSPDVRDLIEGYYDSTREWREYKEQQFFALAKSKYEGLISMYSLDESDNVFIENSIVPSFPLSLARLRWGIIDQRFRITAPDRITPSHYNHILYSRLDETFGSIVLGMHMKR